MAVSRDRKDIQSRSVRIARIASVSIGAVGLILLCIACEPPGFGDGDDTARVAPLATTRMHVASPTAGLQASPISSTATLTNDPTTTPSTDVNPSATIAAGGCPVTPYSPDQPPNAGTAPPTDTWLESHELWAGLAQHQEGRWHTDRQKVAWIRLITGELTITGERLDGPAEPLVAGIPEGYGPSGFQSTFIEFPSAGCWEVVGRVQDAELRFIVHVQPAEESSMHRPG